MLKAGDIVDRYTVEGEIASGGMAEVYRVRHNQLGSVHALKVLVLRTKDIKRRLLQEGRVQAGLNHPNAIMVTDVVEVEGHPGLVMEYVDGPTLGDWVHLDNPSYAEIERVFREVVSAIGEAHRVGLIHRDLKPSNVLLARAGEKRIPKVIDFGLAKVVEEEEDHTRTGVPMGTPSYMAPEQIADAKNVDPRADLFSLGVLLYYMCCRRKAFSGANAVETYNAVLAGTYTPVEEVRPDIPDNLRRAIEVCIQLRPDDRVGSAEDLIDVLDGRNPQSKPEGLPVAAKRSVRQLAAVGLIGGMALGAGILATLFLLGVFEGTPDDPQGRISVDPPEPVMLAVVGDGPAIRRIREERDARTGRGIDADGNPKPFCGARPGVILGYARVPGKAKRSDTWTFDAPEPLMRAAAGPELGCTLPTGTVVEVREKPEREDGDHWLAVFGDGFTLP